MAHLKIKEEHCLIVFCSYKEGNRYFLEFEMEIKVTEKSILIDFETEIRIIDKPILNKIKNLGYVRKDMQSLFKDKNYSYLSTDDIHFKELTQESPERELQSFNLVKEIAQAMDFNIDESYDCVNFNFPNFMYQEIEPLEFSESVKKNIS